VIPPRPRPWLARSIPAVALPEQRGYLALLPPPDAHEVSTLKDEPAFSLSVGGRPAAPAR